MNLDLVWLVRIVFSFYTWAIFIDVILTWFPIDHGHPLVRILHSITEPILAPIRRLIPSGNMPVDFSPVVAILILQLVENLLISLLTRGI